MHIAFDQGVQYLASNRARGFFPEEKDMILNKMILRYIISRLRPKGDGVFELDSMAQEQLKTLITYSAPIPSEILGKNYNVLLPSDLGWFIAANTGTYICSALPTSSTITRYRHTLNFPKSTKSSAKYYVDATLAGVSLSALNTAQGGTWLGLPSKEQLFDVLPQLIQELRKIYPVYADGNALTLFLANSTPINATADAATVASTCTVQTIPAFTSIANESKAPVRIVSSVSSFDMAATPFWKSTPQSVIGHLLGNTLRLDGLSSGIITNSEVLYVRKPRVVSLSLGSNSDIPEEYHDELIDMAVAYAKTELNSPDWEKKLADNKLNTTI